MENGVFERSVKIIYKEPGVGRCLLNDYTTNHALCASMTSLPIQAGHTDCSIISGNIHSNCWNDCSLS